VVSRVLESARESASEPSTYLNNQILEFSWNISQWCRTNSFSCGACGCFGGRNSFVGNSACCNLPEHDSQTINIGFLSNGLQHNQTNKYSITLIFKTHIHTQKDTQSSVRHTCLVYNSGDIQINDGGRPRPKSANFAIPSFVSYNQQCEQGQHCARDRAPTAPNVHTRMFLDVRSLCIMAGMRECKYSSPAVTANANRYRCSKLRSGCLRK
jgi:hypothetical protein